MENNIEINRQKNKNFEIVLLMCKVEWLNRRPMKTATVASDATPHRKRQNHRALYAFAIFSTAQSMDSEANRCK